MVAPSHSGASARAWSAARTVVREVLRKPSSLTVSQWADRYRILPDTSAEPGRWRTDRTPYLREIMDAASDPLVERIVVQKAAQVGFSEVLLNFIGYFIHADPSPVLLVQISSGEAAKFSKERVARMIEDTPELAAKVGPSRSRDSENTIESKSYPGGHLGLVGANAPSGLRSRARRVALMDEVDGYPPSAGDEGDPVELVRKRLTTFWNRLEVTGSTPTNAGVSRIEEAVRECDEVRRYHVPCPHCGHMQVLRWERLRWQKITNAEGEREHVPESAVYMCEACDEPISERQKRGMLEAGAWIADEPVEEPARIAFLLTSLISPFEGASWPNLAREWLAAQGHPLKLQVFVNTRLGEVWDAQGHTLEAEPLLARREVYAAEPTPAEVLVITAGVDVQADRFEVELVGWGLGEESWSLDYLRIPADPSIEAAWLDLEQLVVKRTYRHPSGHTLRVSATAVDSGYHTQQVYKFAAARLSSRVWAVKGLDGPGRPIMGRPHLRTKGKTPLYPVGADSAKTTLFGRLALADPGPGYMHFPAREPYDLEFFRQLTSEKRILKQSRNGRHVHAYVRRPNRRAEVLDCRVYALAAFEGLVAAGLRLDQVAASMQIGPQGPPRGRGSGFVGRWKD